MNWLRNRLRGSNEDKLQVLTFLKVLQWASARQQLSMEEWNDALAQHAVSPPEGDELLSAPSALVTEAHAPALLVVAERRLAFADLIRNEFANLNSEGMPPLLATAVNAWSRVFEIHLQRCQIAVLHMRALTLPDAHLDSEQRREEFLRQARLEQALSSEESEATMNAVLAQNTVMKHWGLGFKELLDMQFDACNDLRLEIGKPKLSMKQFTDLYSRGMAGQKPRLYN